MLLGKAVGWKAADLVVSGVSSCDEFEGRMLGEVVVEKDAMVSHPLRTTRVAQVGRSAAHRPRSEQDARGDTGRRRPPDPGFIGRSIVTSASGR